MLPYSEEKSHKSISTEAATIFSKISKIEKGRTQLLHSLKSLKIGSVGEKKGGGWEHPSTELGQCFFQQCLNIIIGGIKYLSIYMSL